MLGGEALNGPIYYERPESYDHPVYTEKTTEKPEMSLTEAIATAFPEDPDTALAIAKCESSLNPLAVGPTNDYGLFQIHAPTWHETALSLGYEEYRTGVEHNIAMARHIYEQAGRRWTDWVCARKI